MVTTTYNILKNVLVDSCELLVLVKETKKDLDEDTRIEEKGRHISCNNRFNCQQNTWL